MSYGQMKVFSDGDTKMGATTSAPAPGAQLHVTVGNGSGLPTFTGNAVAVFHKSADVGINAFQSFIGAPTGYTGFYFGDPSDENAGVVQYRHDLDQLEMRTGGAGINFVMTNTGDVGLGVAAPTERLHVAGNILATGTVTPSSKKLKKNVNDFSLGLDEVLKLRTVTYQYNGLAGTPKDQFKTGVIAEELQKVVPSLVKDWHFVNKDDEDNIIEEGDYLAIKDSEIKWMLVNAIQDQQKLIEKQAEKIAALEEAVNTFGEGNSINNTNISLTGYDLAELDQNRPNPFNGQTSIDYVVPTDANSAVINIFGISGQLVKTLDIDHVGQGSLNISAENLPAGTYSYQLNVDGRSVSTKKMILSK